MTPLLNMALSSLENGLREEQAAWKRLAMSAEDENMKLAANAAWRRCEAHLALLRAEATLRQIEK